MSDRRNPMYFGRKHGEEERLRAQLERVQQQFQKDFVWFKEITSNVRFDALRQSFPEEQPIGPEPVLHPSLTDISCIQRAQDKSSDATASQEASSGLFGRKDGQECSAVQGGGTQASDGRPPSQRTQSFVDKDNSGALKDQNPAKGSGSMKVKVKTTSPICRRVKNPSITAIAGTIKGVSVGFRPEPPSKPRSYRPPSPAQPPTHKSQSMVQTRKRAPLTSGRTSSRDVSLHEKKSQQTQEDSNSSSESDKGSSGDSDRFSRQKSRKKRTKTVIVDSTQSRLSLKEQSQPVRRRTRPCPVPAVKRTPLMGTIGLGPSEKSGSHAQLDRLEEQSSTHSLPTQELDPARPDLPTAEAVHVPQSILEEQSSSLKLPIKAKARSVDEIIASLHFPGQIPALSESDLMIKELLESVLDKNQSAERERSELEEENILPALENEVSADVVQRTGSPSPAQIPELVLEQTSDQVSDHVAEMVPAALFNSMKDMPIEQVPGGGPASRASECTKSCISVNAMSSQKAQDTLRLPVEETLSDILFVKGTSPTFSRLPTASVKKRDLPPPTSLLSTWIPKKRDSAYGTIHHFCVATPSHVLPSNMSLASRVHHTLDRMKACREAKEDLRSLLQEDACLSRSPAPMEDSETSRILYEGLPLTALERQGPDSLVQLPPRTSDSLEEWQRVAEYYVERPRLELVGQKVPFHLESLKMFWTLAPPKFSAPLSAMEEELFAKYESPLAEAVGSEEFLPESQEDEVSEEEFSPIRHHRGYGNNENNDDYLIRVLSRRSLSLPSLVSLGSALYSEKMKDVMIKRSASTPELLASKKMLTLPSDFQTSMKELELLKEQLSLPQVVSYMEYNIAPPATPEERLVTPPALVETEESLEDLQSPSRVSLAPGKVSLADEARKSGKTFIVYPQVKKSKKFKMKLPPEKLEHVYQQLKQPPRILPRSVSLQRLDIHASNRFATFASRRHKRKVSLPLALDFQIFAEARGGVSPDIEEREWVRMIWNDWFDEVVPMSRPPSMVKVFEVQVNLPTQLEPVEKVSETTLKLVDSVTSVMLDSTTATVEDMEAEVRYLTELIEEQGETSGFNFCRRGALYRKLGKLKEALEDLGRATVNEPLLLDAYWQRHLIYHLQGRNLEALDDLNIILKSNKNHADAYLSKAEIYKNQGDITLAIINYSQALKLLPQDGEIYYSRAEMYEKRGEIILAMDDYAQSFFYNPQRTDAMLKHGVQHFKNSNWNAAIADFTTVIKKNANDAQARTMRGRAYIKQARYVEAIVDLCAAVHLDPLNWLAFYCRGCLLRKTYPQKALKDFSTSVLINDGFENLNSFLHRGILYTELSLWPEAMCDFESVIALDRTVALAHVNLGLIFFLHQDLYYKAIRQFSTAIQVAPTYTRAYLCRAQTYHKIHELPKALKDITRAIHLQPDALQMYIVRGLYLFEMKKYDLASFCIRYAAEMDQGTSPIQRALVQAFHKDFNKAIELLSVALKEQPTPSMFVLLGKIQMKAKKCKEAVESFKNALALLSPSKRRKLAPESAQIFFHLGLCYIEQVHLLKALEAFNSAVRADPDYADAFYQRGLCRMHLNQVKCVEDFNRALAINPKMFQVYLSRAAFYGSQERYTKAILNCNEAIKLEPKSVRAYLYRGALKYYAKVYEFAVQDLTKATQMDPNCSLAYYNRAICYHEIKSYEKALADYSIVLLLKPLKETGGKVFVNRGVLYLEQKDYANALQDFREALQKNLSDVRILLLLGLCHQRLGHFTNAVSMFEKVLRLDPFSADAYVGRGTAYMEYGHAEGTRQAQKDFLTALHLNPKCLKARICLGYNLQSLGRFQRAWNQFTIAIDIDAKSHLAYEGRAIISLQMGDTFAALQDMSAALKLTTTAELLTNRGVIHQFLGKVAYAMKDYQTAITLNPSYALAYFNAANLYLHHRQLSQAKDYYSKALELDPTNESAALNRAITNVLLRNLPEALSDFEWVISRCPFSAAVFFNRANLYSTLQQHELAEKDISKALSLQTDDPLMYKLRADIEVRLGFRDKALQDYKRAVDLQECLVRP